MPLIDDLTRMCAAVPPGGAVMLPRDWLASQLEAEAVTSEKGGPDPLADLTVEELATERGVSESTVRSWLSEKLFPNARKVRRRWLIPREDVRAYFRAPLPQQADQERRGPSRPANLGSWRNHYPKGRASA